MYYKDINDGLYYEPSDEVIKDNKLKKITIDEFNTIKDSINKVDPVLEEKAKAKAYLRDTDWVKAYELEHKLGINIIPADSSKWEIINKRQECINIIKSIDGL